MDEIKRIETVEQPVKPQPDFMTSLYLNDHKLETYKNTEKEQIMVDLVVQLYNKSKSYQEDIYYIKPSNIKKWRKAYEGSLNALDKTTGEESERKSKPLRKMIYEMIESKVDNSIPMPKMTPRYKTDVPVITMTENYIKYAMDRLLTERENDRAERATYIDGTSWYKISWDAQTQAGKLGDVRVELITADKIVPEPGCIDHRKMNFLFEKSQITVANLWDRYHRVITSNTTDGLVDVITYYYKDEYGDVCRFMFTENTNQVIDWQEDWQSRKGWGCRNCGTPVSNDTTRCPECGSEEFYYGTMREEYLKENVVKIANPYEVEQGEEPETEVFIQKGTRIPYYRITQLPFVPRQSISTLDTIYGLSEVAILIDMQDSVNKILTKAEEKILQSGSVITKPRNRRLDLDDKTMKVIDVATQEEANMIQSKQIIADAQQDVMAAQLFYESARASSGITESYQGKRDTTAISGKAKEMSAMQSAGRLESLRVMKSAAFADIYELVFKYFLAFSNETMRFVRVLPNGQEEEMFWNKYMFLRKDEKGNLYYTDDFAFSTDPAATLSNNRTQMWSETLNQFMMGTFGEVSNPRTVMLYWNIMSRMQYPLANEVIAGLNEISEHLPPELEQLLLQNPETVQEIVQQITEKEGVGQGIGGGGREETGKTHRGNVATTDMKDKARNDIKNKAQNATLAGGNI